MALARISGRAAVAVERAAAGRPKRNARGLSRPRDTASAREAVIASVVAPPAFHERSLVLEGHAAAFRIEAGRGWATGALPAGANENEIAKFLSEAVSLAKQMQAVMVGEAAEVHILVADPQASPARQSAIQVSVQSASSTVVTPPPGGSAGHLVAMLEHFLMR